MDSLALQVVPDPHGRYPLSKYTSVLGTPGLTAFAIESVIKVFKDVIYLVNRRGPNYGHRTGQRVLPLQEVCPVGGIYDPFIH